MELISTRVPALFGLQGNGETYNSTHWLFWFGCRCDILPCSCAIVLSDCDRASHSLVLYAAVALSRSISGPMLFLTITWVRKSYARFPTTQIFPLELGALTIVSVNGAC